MSGRLNIGASSVLVVSVYRAGITQYIERVVDGGCVVAGGAGRAERLAAR